MLTSDAPERPPIRALADLLAHHGFEELSTEYPCRSCGVLVAAIRCHYCGFPICGPCIVGEAVCLECGKPWFGGLSDDELDSLARAIEVAEVALAEASRLLAMSRSDVGGATPRTLAYGEGASGSVGHWPLQLIKRGGIVERDAYDPASIPTHLSERR